MSNFISNLTDRENYLPYVPVLFNLTMFAMFVDVIVRGIVLFSSISLSDSIIDGSRILLGYLMVAFFISLIVSERHFAKKNSSKIK